MKEVVAEVGLNNEKLTKDFEIEKIDSEVQLADMFTKGLKEEKFVKIRKLLCGW